MLNPEVELKQYRDQIYKDVIFLLNTRLKLLKQFSEVKNGIVWNVVLGGLSDAFYRSLFDNLITTLSWLFSEAKIDRRSLYWYLNQVKASRLAFSSDEIDGQIERLNNVKDTVNKIKTVRDSWIAHRDPNAFNNPKEFLELNNVSIEDFEILIRLAEEIINEHFGKFDETHVIFDLPINGVEVMAKGEKSRLDIIQFAEKVYFSKRNQNIDEQENAIKELLTNHNLQN